MLGCVLTASRGGKKAQGAGRFLSTAPSSVALQGLALPTTTCGRRSHFITPPGERRGTGRAGQGGEEVGGKSPGSWLLGKGWFLVCAASEGL